MERSRPGHSNHPAVPPHYRKENFRSSSNNTRASPSTRPSSSNRPNGGGRGDGAPPSASISSTPSGSAPRPSNSNISSTSNSNRSSRSHTTTKSKRPSSSHRASAKESQAASTEFFNDEEIPTNINKNKGASSSKRNYNDSERVPLNKTVHPNISPSNNNDDGSRTRSMIMGMSRPVFTGACLLALAFGALTFYSMMETLPLRQDVKDLEEQVDRLEGERNRLAQENSRFQTSNDNLNTSIVEFRQQNYELNQTRIRLDASIVDLTAQIPILEALNTNLAFLVAGIKRGINELQSTIITPLETSVESMNRTVTTLFLSDQLAQRILNDLASRIAKLEQENKQLTQTKTTLTSTVLPNVRNQNAQVKANLNELQTVMSVLGGSAQTNLDQVRQTALKLTRKIEINRQLGGSRMETSSHESLGLFDCGLSDFFPGLFRNLDTPIGNSVNNVMNALQRSVMTPMCLDRSDLESYLDQLYDLDNGMTMNQLVQGVKVYGRAALTYYYPAPGQQTGIAIKQWEEADFQCSRIRKFEKRGVV